MKPNVAHPSRNSRNQRNILVRNGPRLPPQPNQPTPAKPSNARIIIAQKRIPIGMARSSYVAKSWHGLKFRHFSFGGSRIVRSICRVMTGPQSSQLNLYSAVSRSVGCSSIVACRIGLWHLGHVPFAGRLIKSAKSFYFPCDLWHTYVVEHGLWCSLHHMGATAMATWMLLIGATTAIVAIIWLNRAH